jgi:hypothetical protein
LPSVAELPDQIVLVPRRRPPQALLPPRCPAVALL